MAMLVYPYKRIVASDDLVRTHHFHYQAGFLQNGLVVISKVDSSIENLLNTSRIIACVNSLF